MYMLAISGDWQKCTCFSEKMYMFVLKITKNIHDFLEKCTCSKYNMYKKNVHVFGERSNTPQRLDLGHLEGQTDRILSVLSFSAPIG